MYSQTWNIKNLIRLSSSTSSLVQPWVQPEKANMSISYLRCNATKGPFSRSIRINFCPKFSISGVNLSAWKLTRHLSFCRSSGRPLFARRASVLLKCTTLCLPNSGRICSVESIALNQTQDMYLKIRRKENISKTGFFLLPPTWLLMLLWNLLWILLHQKLILVAKIL